MLNSFLQSELADYIDSGAVSIEVKWSKEKEIQRTFDINIDLS